jgi:hypothetical protein
MYNQPAIPPSHLTVIAHFLDRFLGPEIFEDPEYPIPPWTHLENIPREMRKEWYRYCSLHMFLEAEKVLVKSFDRPLRPVETNLVKRRVENFLRENGIDKGNS